MRWTMPIFALALAIALGAISPQPVRHAGTPGHAAGLAQPMLPSLASLSLFASAGAATLADTRPSCPAARPAVRAGKAPDNAMLWAASLRGWSDGPTVRAWRRFVSWTKQGLRPTAGCSTTKASLD